MSDSAIILAGDAALALAVAVALLLAGRLVRREIREHDERMQAEFALLHEALRRGRSPEAEEQTQTATDGGTEPSEERPRRSRRGSAAVLDPKTALRMRILGR